jgi:hypothetical protein
MDESTQSKATIKFDLNLSRYNERRRDIKCELIEKRLKKLNWGFAVSKKKEKNNGNTGIYFICGVYVGDDRDRLLFLF